jgi:hypothetical protein
MTRLISAWRALTPEQRLAGGASGALFVTMFLPWYQQNAVVNAPRTAPLQSRNLNAFQVFSFVEAAVLLVAVAVLYLLFARGERRSFELPGGDGGVVFAAGLWAALLLVLRLFAAAGSRMRADRPEPPLVRRPRHPLPPPAMPPRRAPRHPSPPPATPPRRAPRRPVAAADATEQLSFEDPAPDPD